MDYILHQLHLKKFSTHYKTNTSYKIIIYLQDKYPHDPGGMNMCQKSMNILKNYMKM